MKKRIIAFGSVFIMLFLVFIVFLNAFAQTDVSQKMTQTVKLYEGVLKFPPPIWVNKVDDLNNTKYNRNQDKNYFALEQIPKDQEFESWKNMYGVYGFYLPDYDMERFLNESLNALTLGCSIKSEHKLVSVENGNIILTYSCNKLRSEFVVDGYDVEHGFLYISQVKKTFAKVYLAWRAKGEDSQTKKWPISREDVAESLKRMQEIRYFPAQ